MGKYIGDTEAFASIPSNVEDIVMDYKQMNAVIATTSSKDETFSIEPSGTTMLTINTSYYDKCNIKIWYTYDI